MPSWVPLEEIKTEETQIIMISRLPALEISRFQYAVRTEESRREFKEIGVGWMWMWMLWGSGFA